jgi:hypothetical protein
MMLKRKSTLDLIRHCLALLILLVAPPSFALDFSNSTLVYLEDFDGETNFPTTPEVNTLSIGDNSGVAVDGASNLVDFLGPVGGVVPISISGEIPSTIANVLVLGTFTNSVGMRGVFHNFSIGVAPADGLARAGVAITFGTLSTPTSNLGATLFIDRTGGVITGGIVFEYAEPPAATVFSLTSLAVSELNAVLAGASFTVDFALDKDTLIATASVDIEGEGEFTAAPFDLSGFSGITPSSTLAANGFVAIEHLGADLAVEIDDMSIFVYAAPPPPSSDNSLLDAKLTAGAEVVLQNAGGTIRLEQAQVHAYDGATFYVPEPVALWQLYSGVALLALLYARRRRI